jgi:hypothetical protein
VRFVAADLIHPPLFYALLKVWISIGGESLLVVLGCRFVLAGAFFLLIRPSPFIWCAWEQLAQQAVVTERDSTQVFSVYAFEDLVAYHLWFSFPANSRFKLTVIHNVSGVINDPAYFLPRDFSDVTVQSDAILNENHAWIAFRAAQWD